MWLINLLPDSAVHSLLVLALIVGMLMYVSSLFMNLSPGLLPLKEPARLVSTMIIVVSVYLYGCWDSDKKWKEQAQAHAAEIEKILEKQRDSEAKTAEVNAELSVIQQKNTQLIVNSKKAVHSSILKSASKINANCVVNSAAISILNDAAVSPLETK